MSTNKHDQLTLRRSSRPHLSPSPFWAASSPFKSPQHQQEQCTSADTSLAPDAVAPGSKLRSRRHNAAISPPLAAKRVCHEDKRSRGQVADASVQEQQGQQPCTTSLQPARSLLAELHSTPGPSPADMSDACVAAAAGALEEGSQAPKAVRKAGVKPASSKALANGSKKQSLRSSAAAAAAAPDGPDAAPSSRPRRRTAELAVSRMRGHEAPVDLFRLLTEHATASCNVAKPQQSSASHAAAAASTRAPEQHTSCKVSVSGKLAATAAQGPSKTGRRPALPCVTEEEDQGCHEQQDQQQEQPQELVQQQHSKSKVKSKSAAPAAATAAHAQQDLDSSLGAATKSKAAASGKGKGSSRATKAGSGAAAGQPHTAVDAVGRQPSNAVKARGSRSRLNKAAAAEKSFQQTEQQPGRQERESEKKASGLAGLPAEAAAAAEALMHLAAHLADDKEGQEEQQQRELQEQQQKHARHRTKKSFAAAAAAAASAAAADLLHDQAAEVGCASEQLEEQQQRQKTIPGAAGSLRPAPAAAAAHTPAVPLSMQHDMGVAGAAVVEEDQQQQQREQQQQQQQSPQVKSSCNGAISGDAAATAVPPAATLPAAAAARKRKLQACGASDSLGSGTPRKARKAVAAATAAGFSQGPEQQLASDQSMAENAVSGADDAAIPAAVRADPDAGVDEGAAAGDQNVLTEPAAFVPGDPLAGAAPAGQNTPPGPSTARVDAAAGHAGVSNRATAKAAAAAGAAADMQHTAASAAGSAVRASFPATVARSRANAASDSAPGTAGDADAAASTRGRRSLVPLATAAADMAAAAADAIAALVAGSTEQSHQDSESKHAAGPAPKGPLLASAAAAAAAAAVSGAEQSGRAVQPPVQELGDDEQRILQALRAAAQTHQLLPPPPVIRIKQSSSPPPEVPPASAVTSAAAAAAGVSADGNQYLLPPLQHQHHQQHHADALGALHASVSIAGVSDFAPRTAGLPIHGGFGSQFAAGSATGAGGRTPAAATTAIAAALTSANASAAAGGGPEQVHTTAMASGAGGCNGRQQSSGGLLQMGRLGVPMLTPLPQQQLEQQALWQQRQQAAWQAFTPMDGQQLATLAYATPASHSFGFNATPHQVVLTPATGGLHQLHPPSATATRLGCTPNNNNSSSGIQQRAGSGVLQEQHGSAVQGQQAFESQVNGGLGLPVLTLPAPLQVQHQPASSEGLLRPISPADAATDGVVGRQQESSSIARAHTSSFLQQQQQQQTDVSMQPPPLQQQQWSQSPLVGTGSFSMHLQHFGQMDGMLQPSDAGRSAAAAGHHQGGSLAFVTGASSEALTGVDFLHERRQQQQLPLQQQPMQQLAVLPEEGFEDVYDDGEPDEQQQQQEWRQQQQQQLPMLPPLPQLPRLHNMFDQQQQQEESEEEEGEEGVEDSDEGARGGAAEQQQQSQRQQGQQQQQQQQQLGTAAGRRLAGIKGIPNNRLAGSSQAAAAGSVACAAAALQRAGAAAAARSSGGFCSSTGITAKPAEGNSIHAQQGRQLQQQRQPPQMHAKPKLEQKPGRQRKGAAAAAAATDGDGWTDEEVKALQAAYCQVTPTHRFFWQEVASRVGTRTAGECFDKVFAAARSPQPAKLAKSKMTVPTLKGIQIGANGRPKTTLAAARKLARGLQHEAQRSRVADPRPASAAAVLPEQRLAGWQQQQQLGVFGGDGAAAAAAAGEDDSEEELDANSRRNTAGGSSRARQLQQSGVLAGGSGVNAEALASLQRQQQQQQQADRYISSFLRRRGGWTKYQKQQAQLQQRQQQQQQQQLLPSSNSGSSQAAVAGMPLLNPRDPRQRLGHAASAGGGGAPQQQQQLQQGPRGTAAFNSRSASEVVGDGQGLTRVIGKTLGALRRQVGEWEAVEAEQQVLMEEEGAGVEGAWQGAGDYYFDDEQDGFDEEEEQLMQGLA